MENNLENKSKFFSQYWGQRVVRHLGLGLEEHTFLVNENILCKYDITEYYIRLTSLSSITDEDAIDVARIAGLSSDKNKIDSLIIFGREFSNDDRVYADIFVYQYLQSKGYALHWNSLGIDDLISYGWIKLKGD